MIEEASSATSVLQVEVKFRIVVQILKADPDVEMRQRSVSESEISPGVSYDHAATSQN
jgi:hypothetical protein